MESQFSRRSKKIIYSSSIPLVVKADGLASGKGVFIPIRKTNVLKRQNLFSMVSLEIWRCSSSRRKIQGQKFQFLLYVMERNISYFQPHKITNDSRRKIKGQIQEGWGYSPAPLLKREHLDRIIKEIIEPTIDELNKKKY